MSEDIVQRLLAPLYWNKGSKHPLQPADDLQIKILVFLFRLFRPNDFMSGWKIKNKTYPSLASLIVIWFHKQSWKTEARLKAFLRQNDVFATSASNMLITTAPHHLPKGEWCTSTVALSTHMWQVPFVMESPVVSVINPEDVCNVQYVDLCPSWILLKFIHCACFATTTILLLMNSQLSFDFP